MMARGGFSPAGEQGESLFLPMHLAMLAGPSIAGIWLPTYRVLMVWVYERTRSLPVVMLMRVSLRFGPC